MCFDATILPSQPVARLEFSNVLERGLWRRNAEKRHVLVDRLKVDLARDRGVREQRLKFRTEDQIAVRLVRVEERFLPNAVSGNEKRTIALVPARRHP